MGTSQSWRDHFVVDQTKFDSFWEEFSQNSPMRASELNRETANQSIEFILWCISKGHLIEKNFTHWQADTFQYPILSPNYFATPVDTIFLEKMKEIHPWSASCVPLSEWDGIIYVAVASVEQDFTIGHPHRLVLAAPSELLKYFTKVDRELVKHTSGPKSYPVAEAPTADLSGDPFASLSQSLGVTAEEDQTSGETSPHFNDDSSILPDGLVMPEGMNLTQSKENEGGTVVHDFETGEDQLIKKPEPVAEPAVEPAVEAVVESTVEPITTPEVLTTEPAPQPVNDDEDDPLASLIMTMPPPPKEALEEKAIDEVEIKRKLPGFSIENASPANDSHVTPAVDKKSELLSEAKKTSEPGPPKKPLFAPPDLVEKREKAKKESESSVSENTTSSSQHKLDNTPTTSMLKAEDFNAPTPETPSTPIYMRRSVAIGRLDPKHLDKCDNIDEAGAQAILQTCNVFECGMILLFKSNELIPWKWNDLFLSVLGDSPKPISLTEPSIFKITFRTAKPYHGHVVTNPINQQFFNSFYRGVLPKHATIIPLILDGRMGGMLLGLTNSKIEYRRSLRLMERIGLDLSRVLKNLRNSTDQKMAS